MPFRYLAATALVALAISIPARAQDLPETLATPGTELKKVATGFKFTEGPIWMPEGYLLFSDIPADAVYKLEADGKTTEYLKPSGHSNGLAVDAEGHLILCMHDRCVARQEADGDLTVLAVIFDKKPLNSPNDLTISKTGAIYFTDPPYGIKADQAKQGFNGIYRWTVKDGLELLDKSMPGPNGIALSKDEKLLYVADSKENVIQVFNVEEDGALSNKQLLIDMKVPGTPGASDGLKVDSAGNIVATGPGGVWFISPAGKVLGKLAVPEVTTNLTFGGGDGKTMYITAGKSLYSYQVKNGLTMDEDGAG